jgi:Ras-related protein Rab-11A
MEEDNYEMMFKVVLVGDSFVGKTNIMSKYLKNEFHEDSKATVGVEFGSKQFNIEGHTIKAQIWDTAGQERYKAITSAYYKGAKGAFIVYDITRKQSFESVERWVTDVTSVADKKISIVLIGNKSDLEDQRQVTKEQAEEKANKLEVAFLETSAFSGDNLDKAFDMMINEVYKKCHEEMLAEGDDDIFEGGQDINLNKKPEDANKKKQCCA